MEILWTMLETAVLLKNKYPHLNVKISAARPSIEKKIKEIVAKFCTKNRANCPKFNIVPQSIKLLQECGTGLSKSGTITVECSIAGIPLVVFNKLNPITFLIARCLARAYNIKNLIKKLFRGSFTMPNIIANKTLLFTMLKPPCLYRNNYESDETLLNMNYPY